MIIRKARFEDAAHIAPILLLAMEDIVYKFIGRKDFDSAKDFLLYFVEKQNNQYSYQNCFVAEEENEIIGAVNVYDGALLAKLRTPVIEYVRAHFNPDFNPEDETQDGEVYIDALGVDPKYQGKGIGSKLLQFLIQEYGHQKQQPLGLIVDEDNPSAKKLYIKLGFSAVGKKILVGKNLEHLQYKF
jgi:ribosomal protein S18 acetylase RimI-like enzyme